MNRAVVQPKGFLERGLVGLFATITTGATGAVVGPTTSGPGVTNVVRNSAGLYTVTLQDKFSRPLKLSGTIRGPAGSGVPAAAKADTVFTFNYLVNAAGVASTFQVQAVHALATPVAADITDNWFIDLELWFGDTLLPR